MKKIFIILVGMFFERVQANPIIYYAGSNARRSYEIKSRKCPADKPLWDWEKCHSCDSNEVFPRRGYIYGCEKCSNREMTMRGFCTKKCQLGFVRGPAKKYDRSAIARKPVEECISQEEARKVYKEAVKECATGQFYDWSTGYCNSCKALDNVYDPLGLICERCPNREVINGYCRLKECEPEGYFSNSYRDEHEWGGCVREGDFYSMKALECIGDKPLWDGEKCRSCDTLENMKDNYGCEKCPNRTRGDLYNGCTLIKCPSGYIKNPGRGDNDSCISLDRALKEYEEGAKKCPQDKPLWNYQSCYSCDYLGVITDQLGCEKKCPNRRFVGIKGWFNNYNSACMLKDCPLGYKKDSILDRGCIPIQE